MADSASLDWGEVFARYEPIAIAFVRGLVGDGDLARDLFQEAARATFERASRGAVRFEGAVHARNYLFRVLRNLAADARGRRVAGALGDDTEPADPAPPPAELLAGRELAERRAAAVRAAFARLPSREQEALDLRYLRGLGYQEIAERTGRPISTLQARVEAGLRRLRAAIGKLGGEE